jgi:RNA polymerase sigma-70 factor (ECF subfamily)
MIDLDQHLPGIVAGESSAYAAWLAGAEPRIRASLGRFAEHVDTEAVLQETLLRVWQVAPRLHPDGDANALLRLGVRIARNLAVSEIRRQRIRPAVLDDAPHESLASAEQPRAPDPLLRRIIALCREQLPAKPAQALMLRLQEVGRPDRDLAAAAGMKLNTFLQNVTRARKLLADCLARNGVDLTRELG